MVVVYTGVSRELVRTREALLAARESALEGLLSSVCADMPGLRRGR